MSKNVTSKGTGDIIRDRAAETVLNPGPFGFYDWPQDLILADLVEASPGSEKSKVSTQIATRLWTQRSEASLYLMLTHEAIRQRLRLIRTDGDGDHWQHYKGHDAKCHVSRWASLGYVGVPCNCQHGGQALSAEKPTLAAIDVVLRDHTTAEGFFNEVNWFKLWIMDEIDFGRFVGEHTAEIRDLHAVQAQYPETAIQPGTPTSSIDIGPVRTLAGSLLDIYDQMLREDQERVNGNELYGLLRIYLAKRNQEFIPFIDGLKSTIESLPHTPWHNSGSRSGISNQPKNFPRFLVPILCEEAENYLSKIPFHPRVHLVNDGNHPPLKIRWRRQITEPIWPGPGLEQSVDIDLMVLDATASTELMGNVFPYGLKKRRPPEPQWPSNVHVTQWAENTVSKQQLGLYGERGYDNLNDDSIETWLNRIGFALEGFNKNWPIGVITHQQIEQQLVEKIKGCGFTKTSSMHFYNLRGSNEFERSRVLVILGCPIPNMYGFQEECEAFFHDDERELNFNPTSRSAALPMRDGRGFHVNTFGFWEPPVSDYYWQKCHAELYQAIHRLRPYRPRKYDRHILLFTNTPVKGVQVERVLVDTRHNWKWFASRELRVLLQSEPEVRPDQLCDAAERTTKTITNNADAIAILAGAWFHKGTKGKGGKINKFTLAPGS